MGRKRRPYLPGAVFHLTARTQGHEPWFTPTLRSRIVEYVASAIRFSDARLLAYAIMPNHLHLVLQQRQWPLERVMQPLLRRVAALVQRSHGVEGHVFERRFGDRACHDPEYLRNVVVYAHLNPVRAGLVDDPCAYRWSSHRYYVGIAGIPRHLAPALCVDDALRLFAPREAMPVDQVRRAYARYVDWRIACDNYSLEEDRPGDGGPTPIPPRVSGGDRSWAENFAPLFSGVPGPAPYHVLSGGPSLPDPTEIAVRALAEHAPHLPLDLVRSNHKGRAAVRVRRAIIHRLSSAGHRGAAIARYLRVTDQCVSRVLRSEPPVRS